MSRTVCWFSCGAASAVAAKLKVQEHKEAGTLEDLVIATIFLKNEHEDSLRFKDDCEAWFGHPIITIKDEKYGADVDEVVKQRRYMSGVRGAICTTELKKNVRLNWQRPDDLHVFGMTAEEEHRVNRLLDGEPELEVDAPLITHGLSKEDCFTVLKDAGIDLPVMYKLGYHNNNCIGCLKAGGAGYWNKVRKDFPEVFERRSRQEYLLNVALTKISENKIKTKWPEVIAKMNEDGYERKVDSRGSMRIPLRYLPSDAGSHKDLNTGACGFFCEKIDLGEEE